MNDSPVNAKFMVMWSLKSPIKGRAKKGTRERVALIVQLLNKAIPNPKCELFYQTPYQLLVSVILSAQATDHSVNQAMVPLYEHGLGPEDILRWGEAGFFEKIRRIGLAKTKAKNIYRMTQLLQSNHQGVIPNNREDLEALPGVGRKTANVVLGELYGEPTLAVDTHVFRVTMRLGLHEAKTPAACEQAILPLFNPKDLPRVHHLLILHGRYTCTAKKPKCTSCVLNQLCPSAQIAS